jgi:hypothetical protein
METSAVLPAQDDAVRRNAKGMTGWIKFMGIMSIVGGCLQALTIFGLVIAWLPIWMGVVLTKAGSRAGEYADKGDFASLEGMTGQLKTYFTISGILIIVSFGLTIVFAVAWFVLLGLGAFPSSSLMDYFNRYR